MIGAPSRWLQVSVDLLLVAITWWLAFWLRFNLDVPDEFQALMVQALPWPLLAYGASLVGWRVYRHIWRYTSLAEVTRVFYGVAIGGLLTAAAILMLRVPSFPRSVLLLHPMLVLLALGGVRAMVRLTQKEAGSVQGAGKPLLLVGTVQDAAAALPALRGVRQWTPVGLVSPVAGERGRSFQGVDVLSDRGSASYRRRNRGGCDLGAQRARIGGPPARLDRGQ